MREREKRKKKCLDFLCLNVCHYVILQFDNIGGARGSVVG
jgi:hypothetical protein